VVSFRVSCFEEIENPLKVWLPHIKVLRPKELKMALLKQMKQWVTEQGKEDGIRPP
jgi:hypothetical protein